MATQRERRQRALKAIDGRPIYSACDGALDDLARWLLIERSVYDGELYLTSHNSPDEAADYHDFQEYVDDWIVDALVDLDTGTTRMASTQTTWEPA